MRLAICLLCALVMIPPGVARAQVLVELFTSQGCSSCPPADRLLGELAERDDVVALAFHVDYWDYLGWKDTFAKPEHSARQRAYAYKVDRQWIGRNIGGSFTPEVVIQGRDSLIGSSRSGIAARIMAHAERAPAAKLTLARDGDDLLVSIAPGAAPRTALVLLARYNPTATVDVKRGENAGRTITYSHVVTSFTSLGEWDGTGPQDLRVSDVPGHLAVFLQNDDDGAVLAAAKID